MSNYTDEQLAQAKASFDSMGALRRYADDHLEKRGRDNYVCPFCGSGNGPKKSAAFTLYGDHFKCFSCEKSGDVLDLVEKVEGIEGYVEKIEFLANAYGVILGDGSDRGTALDFNGTATVTNAPLTDAANPTVDYSNGRERHRKYIEAMRKNVDMPDAVAYITSRGFTMEEAHELGFGYDPYPKNKWQDAEGKWYKTGRLILPWKGSDYYHIDRACDNAASKCADKVKYVKPKAEEVGPQPLHNPDALKHDEVFIVEGLLDSYALEVMGFQAIAIGGRDATKTLQAIASLKYQGTVILMLDDDEKGQEGQEKAVKTAKQLNLDVVSTSVLRSCLASKDPNEAMLYDRDRAKLFIGEIVLAARKNREERIRKAEAAVLENAKLQRPTDVALGVFNCIDSEDPVPTGIKQLDLVANGGLRSGLTVLGAGSSLGKTTLVSQICDNIARSGHPCLFISIEQSSREIVCKSLSRLMAMRGYEGVGAWEMTTRSQRDKWEDNKTYALFDAYEDYVNNISPNLMLMIATEQPTVADIRNAVMVMRKSFGVAPVVFLDYLQLLAPSNERMSDKQAVDNNLRDLRCLARDESVPIVVISSINRTSYSGQIEFESFKESGGIEFSADLLIGLQPYRIAERIGKVKGKDAKEKAARDAVEECRTSEGDHRDMELRVLKNRNGYVPRKALPLTFYPASSQFVDGVIG